MSNRLDVRPLADQAHSELRRLILAGDLALGQAVAEDTLAARLGISRTPVREALRRLAEEGLIEAGGRARVRVAGMDDETARGIAEVRGELDALAAALCARRRDPALSERLAAMATEIERRHAANDLAGAFAADGAFHLALAEASGNSELLAHLRRLDGRVQLLRLHRCHDMAKIRRDVATHHRLVALVAAGDGDGAADLARRHARGESTP